MTNEHNEKYLTSEEKRKEVNAKFYELTDTFIKDYPTSAISWHSNKYRPIIHPDVLKELPENVIKSLEVLLQGLEP